MPLIRLHAHGPITNPVGVVIGTWSVSHYQSRALDHTQAECLTAFARQVGFASKRDFRRPDRPQSFRRSSSLQRWLILLLKLCEPTSPSSIRQGRWRPPTRHGANPAQVFKGVQLLRRKRSIQRAGLSRYGPLLPMKSVQSPLRHAYGEHRLVVDGELSGRNATRRAVCLGHSTFACFPPPTARLHSSKWRTIAMIYARSLPMSQCPK